MGHRLAFTGTSSRTIFAAAITALIVACLEALSFYRGLFPGYYVGVVGVPVAFALVSYHSTKSRVIAWLLLTILSVATIASVDVALWFLNSWTRASAFHPFRTFVIEDLVIAIAAASDRAFAVNRRFLQRRPGSAPRVMLSVGGWLLNRSYSQWRRPADHPNRFECIRARLRHTQAKAH